MLMALALAAALPATFLHAQDQNQNDNQNPPPPGQNGGPPDGGPRGPGRGHRLPPLPLIGVLDANHDGVISADEIANAPTALKTLDKNGDGQLTKDEYMPPRPQGDGQQGGPPPADNQSDSSQAKPQHPLPPIIAALDTNGDGVISADEIANASASLLKLDKNGDGQLTRDEIMPPRPDRGGHGPGGQRPPPSQNN